MSAVYLSVGLSVHPKSVINNAGWLDYCALHCRLLVRFSIYKILAFTASTKPSTKQNFMQSVCDLDFKVCSRLFEGQCMPVYECSVNSSNVTFFGFFV